MVGAVVSMSSAAHAQLESDDIEITATSSQDDLEIEAAPSTDSATSGTESASSSTASSELDELRARVAQLEAHLVERAHDDEATPEQPPPTPTVTQPAGEQHDFLSDVLRGFSVSAYLQAQYVWSQLSQDEVDPDGNLLNRDRFDLRRARVRLTGNWGPFSIDLEVNGSTTRGPVFGLYRATVGLAYANGDRTLPPYIAGLVGMTEIPFGHEVRLGQRDMPFMERSTGSLAFFRGPIDIGAKVQGALGPIRYDVAVMTGSPIDDRAGSLSIPPTAQPDVVGRIGFDSRPHDALTLAGGASFLWGSGFSAGQPARSSSIEWVDLNQNGMLDTGELMVLPGRAATPSATFQHWALGADLELALTTALGRTDLFGEVVLATNLDRALFVADPVVSGADVREVSAYVAIVQSILGWGVVGFRYDYYDPNSDFVDQRRGLSVPTNASMHTFSPMVGVTIPSELYPGFRARLVFQYDAIVDHLGRDSRGVPTDLANDQFTIRVQGEVR